MDLYEWALLIGHNFAHPDFRDELHGYLEMVEGGHMPRGSSRRFARAGW